MRRVIERLAQLRPMREPEWADQPAPLEERAGPFGPEPDISAPKPKTAPSPVVVDEIAAPLRPEPRTGLPPKRGGRPPSVAEDAALTREESRAALVALREQIEAECPDADPGRGLLRQAMLDELVRRRPTDADE